MRTDVKVGLICAFAIVLCVVIYFVARGNHAPAPPISRSDAPHVLQTPSLTPAPALTSDPVLPGRTVASGGSGGSVGGGLITIPHADTPTTMPAPATMPATPTMGPSVPTLTVTPGGATPYGTARAWPELPGTTPLIPSAAGPTQPTLVITPPPGTAGPTASLSGATTYKIQRGDMLTPIAKKYGVTVNAIVAANQGLDPARLKIDAVIKIPAPLHAATPVASTRPAAPATRPAVVTTVATTIKPGTTYKVKKGDTLTTIARAAYGATGSWKKIFQANQAAISDPDVVPIGTQITIPQ